MKKLWFVLLVAGVLTGCSKDDGAENGSGNGNNGGNLPALPDPNDVCSAMDDIDFMDYCYYNFDVNKDGKVSTLEAGAVRTINIYSVWDRDTDKWKWDKVRSIKGIEYFPNLESLSLPCGELSSDLDCGSVLRYNKKLKYISLRDSSFSMTDLSQCQSLEEVFLEGKFGTVLLPQTIPSVELYCASVEKLKCYAIIPPVLDVHYKNYGSSVISTIYVPKEQVDVYKATFPWNLFDIQPL